MQKIVFIFFLLSFSPLSYSSSYDHLPPEYIKNIDSIMCATSKGLTSGHRVDCQNCETPPIEEKAPTVYKNCVKKICSRNQRPSMKEQFENMEKNLETNFDKYSTEVKDSIEELFAAQEVHLRDQIKGLKDQLDGKNKSPSNNVITLKFGNYAFFQQNGLKLAYKWDKSSHTLNLDEKKTKRNLSHLTRHQQNWLLSMARRHIELDLPRPGVAMMMLEPGVSLIKRYNADNLEGAIQSAIRESKSLQQKILKEKPEYSGHPSLTTLENKIRQFEEGNTLSSMDQAQLYTSILSLETFYKMEKDPTLTRLLLDKDIQTESSGFSPEEEKHLRNGLVQMERLFNNPSKLNSLRNEAIERCIASYGLHIESLPTKEQMELFKENLGDYKSRIKRFANEFISKRSRPVVHKEIDSASLAYPETKEGFKKSFKQKLRAAKDLYTHMKTNQFTQSSSSSLLANKVIHFEDEDLFLGSFPLCEQATPRGFTDKVYTTKGAIWVSSASITNPEAGKMVTHHEMGHVLSQGLQQDGLSQKTKNRTKVIHKCLDQKHKRSINIFDKLGATLSGKAQPYMEAEQFVEEDFADMVEAALAPKEAANPNCLFIDTRPNSHSPLHVEHYTRDTHSTDFFRLLHFEHVARGRLPRECNFALKHRGKERDFSSCLPSPIVRSSKKKKKATRDSELLKELDGI